MAKATFYKHFPAKDDLVLAYLDRVDEAWTGQLHAASDAAGTDPAARLVGAFDALGNACRRDGYRGCAFINAAAENPPAAGSTTGRWRTRTRSASGWRGWPRRPAPPTPPAWPAPSPCSWTGASPAVRSMPGPTRRSRPGPRPRPWSPPRPRAEAPRQARRPKRASRCHARLTTCGSWSPRRRAAATWAGSTSSPRDLRSASGSGPR